LATGARRGSAEDVARSHPNLLQREKKQFGFSKSKQAPSSSSQYRPRNWLGQAAGGAAPSGGSKPREAGSVGAYLAPKMALPTRTMVLPA
jgi:hypothetical protein